MEENSVGEIQAIFCIKVLLSHLNLNVPSNIIEFEFDQKTL